MKSTRLRKESVLSIKVVPHVKRAWEELDDKTKRFLINKFQMEILGLKGEEIPDDVKIVLKIEYDKETLELIKELVLGRNDYEEMLELAKSAVNHLMLLWNAQRSYGGCELIESNKEKLLPILKKAHELGLIS